MKNKDRCPCGGIILADTEDWSTPLCYSCFYELTIKTKDMQKLQKQNEKLKTALELYAMTNETFPEYGELARDILKEIEGEK